MMSFIRGVFLLTCVLVVGCAHQRAADKKQTSALSYLEHLKAADVCQSIRDQNIQFSGDDSELVNRMWLSDLAHFEKQLDKVSKQKGMLIKTFLWARESNLVPFPSAFYLNDKKQTYANLQKRVELFKAIADPLTPPSLLKHILQEEIRSFSMKEGEGKVNDVLESYVQSFILKSAPSERDFLEWLADSCRR